MPSKNEPLIKSYRENIPVYEKLTQALQTILTGIVEQENIDCAMPVQSRTKDILSYLEKVERKKYGNPLRDMTDISGSRIVLFTEKDVRFMADAIEDRFKIDTKRSINKREQLGRNQFGYSGMNYVASFNMEDPILVEHSEFENKFFEIQLLTICQLLWAEMQRRIEYKIEDFVSLSLSRRLSMLGALFELADIEFQYLRDKGVEELLMKPITIRSLRIYLNRSSSIGRMLSEGVREGVLTYALPEEDLDSFDELYEICLSSHLKTLSDLDTILTKTGLVEHLFASAKKHKRTIRTRPVMLSLLLLYHNDQNVTKDILLARKWNEESIDFIVDRT
jgi:ppGpp synthetase/RelA/SpoT-type nucleotidyltranferase